MKITTLLPLVVAATFSHSVFAAQAEPGKLPPARVFGAAKTMQLMDANELQSFKALAQYHEPTWVSKLVAEGKLPPVKERLPKEPLVYSAASMSDGIGQYGGVLRHVIGGRPEGWNWAAGQTLGWGGINYAVAECLTRTGPLFTLNPDQQQPLPNLAKSWEWSKDAKTLTMHLIEGAKWSDGAPFTSEDVIFYWEDNVLDTNVTAFTAPATFGEGAQLTALDDYTIQWTFAEPSSAQVLFKMAFFQFCPGPAHLLKPEHPRYNTAKTYQDYRNAQPANGGLPIATMGAWVPVEHRTDEIIVLRRNPYFWKVDEQGNQLPYINEMHYRLSTWGDRTVQTVAGSADFSNMENPANYVSALTRAQQKDSPARLDFGPRTLGWAVSLNMSETLSTADSREVAIRQLNRNLKFRQAISHAINRDALGQSLVKGPFSQPFAGGIYPDDPSVNADSVVFYAHNLKLAKALLDDLGLRDTDNDGIRNWTSGPQSGSNVEIALIVKNDHVPDTTLAEGMVAMMQDIGIRLIPRPMHSNSADSLEASSEFEWMLKRGDENRNPVQKGETLAALHNNVPLWHRGGGTTERNLQPFEKTLASLMARYLSSADPVEQAKLIAEFNHLFTENVYQIGLTSVPGALIVNKRVRNIPAGTPILAYQWAEDAVMRERLWLDSMPKVDELLPETLPLAK